MDFVSKNENGFKIVELAHINELHQLRIKLLEKVKDAKEVCRAKLYDKRNLTDLSLEWGEIRNVLDPDLDEKRDDSDCGFASLEDCPKLQELPSLPPKLRKLEIDNIGSKTFNLLQGTSNCYIMSSLAAVRNLIIRNCGDLIYLKGLKDLGTAKNSQLTLNELIIKDPSVLLMEPLSSITSIQKLTIKGNGELVSFPVETEHGFSKLAHTFAS
ncbi:hypothetical protein IEQ34_008068 [Dendrobium chrysotoxum]|uniref:R13L1/DRL21-like LRR repeat region domain-containing protein n=1 Tax=Dendrobium chrysotoxum TaxID=161865 RepID=A0AAV7H330_DENCH|nr:hypothetical protein IEQ34_008068 [Dendrobium chrysotoxum]